MCSDTALGARDPAAEADPAAGGLLLEQSRWPVERLSRDPCRTSFVAHGHGPDEMSWIASPGRRYSLEVTAEAGTGAPILRDMLTADPSGRVAFVLPAGQLQPLQVVLDAGCGN